MIGAIWAQSTDGVIGDGTTMPWHIPEDLAHFQKVTSGHPVMMGRATWESLPERFRPLPRRENIVVSSREPGSWSSGAHVISDPQRHIDAHPQWRNRSPRKQVWVMGGGQLYSALLPLCHQLEVTLVDMDCRDELGEAAVYAPSIPSTFTLAERSEWHTSSSGTRYRFFRFHRAR